MKDSVGSDPFADDEPEDEDTGETEETHTDSDVGVTQSDTTDDVGGTSDAKLSRDDLPYVLRRKSVKAEREMTQLHLRPEFKEQESAFVSEVADELGMPSAEVSLYDVREAMYRVALENSDAVAEKLIDDGYNLK